MSNTPMTSRPIASGQFQPQKNHSARPALARSSSARENSPAKYSPPHKFSRLRPPPRSTPHRFRRRPKTSHTSLKSTDQSPAPGRGHTSPLEAPPHFWRLAHNASPPRFALHPWRLETPPAAPTPQSRPANAPLNPQPRSAPPAPPHSAA